MPNYAILNFLKKCSNFSIFESKFPRGPNINHIDEKICKHWPSSYLICMSRAFCADRICIHFLWFILDEWIIHGSFVSCQEQSKETLFIEKRREIDFGCIAFNMRILWTISHRHVINSCVANLIKKTILIYRKKVPFSSLIGWIATNECKFRGEERPARRIHRTNTKRNKHHFISTLYVFMMQKNKALSIRKKRCSFIRPSKSVCFQFYNAVKWRAHWMLSR